MPFRLTTVLNFFLTFSALLCRSDTYTTDPAYGDGNYVGHYTDLWSPTWQHFDNLDHIRPDTGVPAVNRVGVWNLPGRDFPGPAADPVP